MIKLIIKYLPSVVVPTICSSLIMILYGNYLSPADFGEYNLFLTTVTLINAVLFSFVQTSVLRLYYEYQLKGQEKILISTYVIISLAILVVLLIPFSYFAKELGVLIVLCLAGSVFNLFFINVLRSTENVKWFNIVKILIPIITLLLIIFFIIFSELDKQSALISFYLPMFVTSTIMILVYLFQGKIRFIYNHDVIKKSFSYGVPLAISGLLNIVLSSSDRFLIQYFLGSEQVGLYSFGYRIAELVLVNITMVIMLALFPQVIKEYDSKGKVFAANLLAKYLNFHFIIIIPTVFILFMYTDEILNVLFPSYSQASLIVKFVTLGTMFYTIGLYTNKVFELTKSTKQILKILLICVCINTILNLLLIPLIGTMGAVFSTISAYISYVFISCYMMKSNFKLKIPYRNIFIILVINLIICLGVSLIPVIISNFILLDVIIKIMIYLSLYSVIIYIFVSRRVVV